jgi:hypothetical protein
VGGYATGGHVSGAGSGTSDSIPAMLSNGEYVIKASTAKKFGVGFLNQLNAGKVPQHRAEGGLVGSSDSISFKSIVESVSGFSDGLRNAGFLSSMVYASGNGSSITDSLLTNKFNATSMGGRFSNLFTGKADKDVYEMVSGAVKGILETLILSMGIGSIPGIGQILAMMPLLEGLALKPAQGISKGLRTTGAYEEVNPTLSKFLSLFEEAKTLSDVKGYVLDLPKTLLRSASSKISDGISGLFNWAGYATGGHVSGAGTGTSDSIPAMLSNGEFVINASASRKLGLGFLNKLNRGESPIFRDSGGIIGSEPIPSAASKASSAGSRLSGTARDLNTRLAQINIEIAKLTSATSDNTDEVSTLNESVDEGGSGSGKGGKGSRGLNKFQDMAEGVKSEIAAALKTALINGDPKELFTGILDAFTNKVLDSFVTSLTDSLFESVPFDKIFKGVSKLGEKIGDGLGDLLSDMFGGEDGLFSKIGGMLKGGGEGGGGFLSGIAGFFSKIFPFDQGGIVPSTSTSQVGKDSVPALLKPGEMVIPPNRINGFMKANGGNNGTAVINLNVTGDVSRQTRREILEMIPEIANGVNANNKELGVR